MNYNIFTNQMTGKWIAQSTNYYLRQNNNTIPQTFVNQVQWTCLQNYKDYIDILTQSFLITGMKSLISLYYVEFTDSRDFQEAYYIVCLQGSSNQMCLLKFNKKFDFINKFILQDCSKNYFSVFSQINNSDITIIQKIYFLNNNVKMTRSIIKKYNQYIATSFSSAIRIS